MKTYNKPTMDVNEFVIAGAYFAHQLRRIQQLRMGSNDWNRPLTDEEMEENIKFQRMLFSLDPKKRRKKKRAKDGTN